MVNYLKALIGIASPTPGGGSVPCGLVTLVILGVPVGAIWATAHYLG